MPDAHEPLDDASLPGVLPDAAKPGGAARKRTEGPRAQSGPASSREHPAALELGEILRSWTETKVTRFPSGLPLIPFMFEALANRLAEGVSLEDLRDVVEGVRGGTGTEAFARDRAKDPAAAAYGSVESCARYAHAGRKARAARLAIERREARYREAERARAAAEPAPTAEDHARAAEWLSMAAGVEGLKPSSRPGGPAGSPARAAPRSRDEQLELLARMGFEDRRAEQLDALARFAREAAGERAGDGDGAGGDVVAVQVVYVDAATKHHREEHGE